MVDSYSGGYRCWNNQIFVEVLLLLLHSKEIVMCSIFNLQKVLVIMISLALLSGCATSYTEENFFTGGFLILN